MNLMTKWEIRQTALSVIQFLLSATAVLIAIGIIRIRKWLTFGCAIYGRECPVEMALGTPPFWYVLKHEIFPLIPFLVLTYLLDRFIIGPITMKLFE